MLILLKLNREVYIVKFNRPETGYGRFNREKSKDSRLKQVSK
jgi:hypothetical protein